MTNLMPEKIKPLCGQCSTSTSWWKCDYHSWAQFLHKSVSLQLCRVSYPAAFVLPWCAIITSFALRLCAMASIVAASTVVAPAAFAAASSAVMTSEASSVKAFSGLKSATLFSSKAQTLSSVQNGSRVQCMQVWNPIGMTKFETFSYLPPLSDDAIAKQVEYMIQQNLIPCLEFDVNANGVSRTNNSSPGYYDGRYWTMWKLPMFGCQDSAQVLREIEECKKTFPGCFVRVLGFDNVKQVQICGFLVARPN
ncbi:ribulose bisphosphate carboxylase small subunit, chloroplastic-like [Physcomitrium patens]|uniref:Ribulose bisphosphate carboxylase small subunit, chloroplastic n=1 Tax=Physcomitrium patens TaxID=3218 RepID=A0A2K1IWT7_PHYPA|nr:hypothetical protein PHYPA_023563 [Physcomitrium patens]